MKSTGRNPVNAVVMLIVLEVRAQLALNEVLAALLPSIRQVP
jgi:hypothetical protein